MRLSFRDWLQNGWLTAHRSSAEEIRNLLGLADRDLRASRSPALDADWRFAIAYNAALQSATAALAAAGYRATRDAHHYRVIESLGLTLQADVGLIRRFDAFRKKRNRLSYELAGAVSDQEAAEMLALAALLREEVQHWIQEQHTEFC